MKGFRIFLISLSFLLFLHVPLSLATAAESAFPGTSAECACLYLPHNNSVLYGKNENRRHPMASTTKIMTALVAIENSSQSEVVTVSPDAVGVEGSSLYLTANARFTMESLLYGMMLESANDAAAAIAIHVGGSVEGFADLMNEKAAELGLTDTHFENPHGLAEDGHYTTALELAKITAAALENRLFAEIVATKHRTITDIDGTLTRSLANHNKLLRAYPDCVGVKTGFTRKSGRCLVSAAEREGMRLVAVTLGAPDDWRDHTAMLDFGFSLYEGVIPVSDYTCRIPVLLGTQDRVTLTPDELLHFVIRQGEAPITARVEVNRYAVAPIEKGQALGKLVYYQDGKRIAEAKLLATESIPALSVRLSFFDKIKKFFKM